MANAQAIPGARPPGGRSRPGVGPPAGTVTFRVGNRVVARVALDAAGQARFARRFASRGGFVIQAVYSGDGSFAGSAQSLTERVRS
jgi:Bacterial Ig-like domain (group 3)